MKRAIAFLAGAFILINLSEALAQGTSGFEILRLPTFPRGSALGGATVADAGNIESIFYNPAGLRSLQKRTAIAGYMDYVLDIGSGFLAYAEPRGIWGTYGASIIYTNYGDFDRRDANGNDLGSFSASDLVFALSYAYDFLGKLNVGANGKFVYSTIEDYVGNALALDLGAQYELIPQRLRLGGGIFNLGVTTRPYVETHEDLPLYYRLGVSGSPQGLPAMLYFSMTLYQEYADNYSLSNLGGGRFGDFLGEIYYSLGAEFKPIESFYLRVGYDTQGLDQRAGTRKDALAGVSGGFGFDLTIARMDFGLASYGELGLVHRVSVSTGF